MLKEFRENRKSSMRNSEILGLRDNIEKYQWGFFLRTNTFQECAKKKKNYADKRKFFGAGFRMAPRIQIETDFSFLYGDRPTLRHRRYNGIARHSHRSTVHSEVIVRGELTAKKTSSARSVRNWMRQAPCVSVRSSYKAVNWCMTMPTT